MRVEGLVPVPDDLLPAAAALRTGQDGGGVV
jgi:hypothetical protein